MLLGAFLNGLSFQPNLLPRGSQDQAVISGIAAASAFGWASASHSVFRSLATRVQGAGSDSRSRAASGGAVDAVLALAALAAARSLRPQEGESAGRAVARLAAVTTAATACAGVVADALELGADRRGHRSTTAVVTLAAWFAGYLQSRRGTSGSTTLAAIEAGREATRTGEATRAGREATRTGREATPATSRAQRTHWGDELAEEPARAVDVPTAASVGLLVTGTLLGLGWLQSRLSDLAAGGAAVALGGEPDDRRAVGRAVVWAMLGVASWWGLTRLNAVLTTAGHELEPAHMSRPERPEVTGGPGSAIPWEAQTLEGRRWLTMTPTASAIEEVMREPSVQPIRLYAPLGAATSVEERANLLLAEIDRTEALRRPVFVLFTPTGSGYVNYVATEAVEFLTRGRCASAAVQYSVLPSAMSLTRVGLGAVQTRIVLNGIVARLLSMPAAERPRFYAVGESLGAGVGLEPFAGQGIGAPAGVGLAGGIWFGTPAGTAWRDQLWGDRPLHQAPTVDPGGSFLPRWAGDWWDLHPEERSRVRFLLLDNGNDPVPKTSVPLLWRRPPWLGEDDMRPPGAPRGTWWTPVTTFFTTFVDLHNALTLRPGRFGSGGHDYRHVLPDAVRHVFRLDADDAQMVRVEAALRRRELVWEVRRRWSSALEQPTDRRAGALADVVEHVARWTGEPASEASVQELVASSV